MKSRFNITSFCIFFNTNCDSLTEDAQQQRIHRCGHSVPSLHDRRGGMPVPAAIHAAGLLGPQYIRFRSISVGGICGDDAGRHPRGKDVRQVRMQVARGDGGHTKSCLLHDHDSTGDAPQRTADADPGAPGVRGLPRVLRDRSANPYDTPRHARIRG